jgi:hypothetical protein
VKDLVLTLVASSVMAVWLLLTIVYQIPHKRLDELKALDRFGLVGRYNFFAPLPGTSDYHLLVRDHCSHGVSGAWREVVLAGPPRNLFSALWNPDKRDPKAFFDVTSMLARCVSAWPDAKERLPLSVPYLMLLNAVAGTPASPLVLGRQFLVMRTDEPAGKPITILLSNVHEV